MTLEKPGVAFDEGVALAQALTTNPEAMINALMAIAPRSGTAIDAALQVADNELTSASHKPGNRSVILLLTDGENRMDPDPIPVAAALKARNIRIVAASAGKNLFGDVPGVIVTGYGDYYYSGSVKGIPPMIAAAVQKVRCGE